MKLSECICALLGLGLVGCSVGPDFKLPDSPLPAAWSFGKRPPAPAANPTELARWWRRFHDAKLTALVEQAVTQNLDVRQAVARLVQVRAQRQSAVAPFFPWLNASGSEQESQRSNTGHTRSYQGGLNASWEIDLFGGNRRNLESADARVVAAAADLDAVRLSMAAEVAQAYCQLRAVQDLLSVARRNLTTQQANAQITHDRRGAGFASDLDVANADASVANTTAAIPSLETSSAKSIHALSVLLGRPPGDLAPMLSDTRPVPTDSSVVPTGVPSDLLRRRPDIRSAEANAHAATARIGVAVSDLFPKFSLNGSVTQQNAQLSDWLSPSSRASGYGPSFNWALFQGGNVMANIRVQEALRAESVLAYRKTVLVALQEVEDSMLASTNDRRRQASLTVAVAANRRALELATNLYTAGQSDFLNVLNAQRSLLQSESEFSQSNLALASDLIALYKALSGGW
jgi:NodT family efflux transporter outer membrane factor (OMF) lipoprotein